MVDIPALYINGFFRFSSIFLLFLVWTINVPVANKSVREIICCSKFVLWNFFDIFWTISVSINLPIPLVSLSFPVKEISFWGSFFFLNIFDINGGINAQVITDFGTAIIKPRPRLNNCLANKYFFDFCNVFSPALSVLIVFFWRNLDGFLSIFSKAFETGKDAHNIIKYPTADDARDFVQAYFLFSISVFGVDIIASGRTAVDITRDADAINNELLFAANSSPFLKNLFV